MAPHCRLTERIRAIHRHLPGLVAQPAVRLQGFAACGRAAQPRRRNPQAGRRRPARKAAVGVARAVTVSATFILFVPLLGYAERREARSKQLPSSAMQSVGR